MRGPATGTIPTCSRWATANLRWLRTARHFSMWAMLAAPLLAGNDLPNMKPEIKAILTNRDVIAIDQDKLGKQGTRAYSDGEVEVWTRHLSGGAMAIAVLNAGADRYSTHPFHLSLAKLGLHGPQTGKDLWTGKDIDAHRQHADRVRQPRHPAGQDRLAEITRFSNLEGKQLQISNAAARAWPRLPHRNITFAVRPGSIRYNIVRHFGIL